MKPYPKMNPDNTALVVIDAVNGCCHEECEDPEFGITFSKIREMIPRLSNFIEEYRKNFGGKIIFTNLTPWTKEYLPENVQELYTDPVAEYYSDGSDFENGFYFIEPQTTDEIVTKNNYDTFANPDFEKLLQENNIRYLVITGVFTDGCVLATISGGFSRGYNFVILKDLIETTDLKARQELSERLVSYTFPVMYGKTINSAEFFD